MNNDIIGSILIMGFVGALIVITEVLARTKRISKADARKALHISAGHMIFFVPLFDNKILITAIPLFFAIVNVFLSPISPIKKTKLDTFAAGHKMGTIYYPISLALVIYFGFENFWLALASFLPVVYGDGFAAVVGVRAKSGIFKIWGNTKSLIGTLTVSFASWLSVLLGTVFLGFSIELAIISSSIVAVLAPLIELTSPKGTDNLIIPPVIFSVLYLLSDRIIMVSLSLDIEMYLIGVLAGALLALISYKIGLLTTDGVLAGFLLSSIILGIGGWVFGVQLFLFFIMGSLATTIVRKKKKDEQDEFEKGSEKRDSKQALAKSGNAAIVVLIYLLYPSISLFYLFSAIMATSLIDTMSTEIGISFGSTPVQILRPWVKALPGENGAVSAIGTIGGYLSGLVLAGVVVLTFLYFSLSINILLFMVLIPVAGTIGMLSDSILGAIIQRKNICIDCGKILESSIHHGKPTKYHQGLVFINNDIVNLLGTSFGGLFGWLFYTLATS